MNPCKQCLKNKGQLFSNTYENGETDYWVACMADGCYYETPTFDTADAAIAIWNEPSEEQKLRSRIDDLERRATLEIAERNSEIARLRNIIRKVEWSVVVFGEIGRGYRQCPVCMNALSEGHDEECPFYQWEGGA